MEMGGGYRPQSHRISLNADTLLVIKLPDLRFLLVLSRSLFLATVIVTLPWIRSVLTGPSGSVFNTIDYHQNSGSINLEYWNLLWQDFADEGLIRKGDKALILNSAIQGVADGGSMFVNDNEIDLVVEPDLERQSSLPDEGFDFVFVFGSLDSKFVDRVVKIGGVIAMQLGDDISSYYQKQSDYRIVYLKKYSSTILAMRKLGSNNHLLDSSAKRRLCQLTLEARKAALKGLEDVLFEPPRRALAKSHAYLRKMNFLPDLLGDSLEHYPRRVFINVGSSEDKNVVMKWFDKNYPKRNQEFEFYSLEMGLSGGEGRRVSPRIDVSDWLMKNAREEEYVVMKAEADAVEEMIARRAISLVDELFLECDNQWQDGGKKNKKKKKSKRAYWECLALYGRLRDEGVAVHQWWD
ncbi:hypothetical protein QUC31_015032 [Theobroma cacao]|uniref:Uncharacterized protein LOC18608227 n=2 Tax=Theobroma cacao TaxID=3641 RepID=A0AB32W0D4_THECC|nr:PREDICTED: uncharacterized protein LOC18608227 [Theobroma cacao]EOX98701.1 Nuclear transcription factor Y subunit C-4, putative [Theobroma cacao]WRX15946.1 hypothetical protein QQP08_008433 [Theobroma cacao]